MTKQKQCIDLYGERLKVGDEVIPVIDEAVMIGISGIISKIEYVEKYNNHYITIADKEGNILLEGVDARCYTTQARFDEREKQEYVYSLSFFDAEHIGSMTFLPLTNRTDSNYEIPDDTAYVTLIATHQKSLGIYTSGNIYYFISELYYEKLNKLQKLGYLSPLDIEHRIFKNEEELKKYVKNIIEYFNSADLTNVDNDKEFEKKLIHHLKH